MDMTNADEMIQAAAIYYYYSETQTTHTALDYQVLLELREDNEVTN